MYGRLRVVTGRMQGADQVGPGWLAKSHAQLSLEARLCIPGNTFKLRATPPHFVLAPDGSTEALALAFRLPALRTPPCSCGAYMLAAAADRVDSSWKPSLLHLVALGDSGFWRVSYF